MNTTVSIPPARPPFAYRHEAALAALLILLAAAFAIVDPAFMSPATQAKLATHTWEMAILAVPMTLIILTGGIDLSVGSAMALCAVVFGLAHRAGAPLPLAAAAALLTGAAAGALNGVFIAATRVHPLLVTLATLAAFRGLAEGVSSAEPLSGYPDWFTDLGTLSLAGLSIAAGTFLVAVAAAWIVLSATPLGTFIRAIGYNETATRLSAVRVDRIKLALYTCSGLAAAVAALLLVARRNTAKADIATGIELQVITVVVLGGTSIFGGRGHILGTLLGIALLHETRQFVIWHWNRDELNLIVTGTLLIAAVLLNRLLSDRKAATP